jgi:5'-nucleotidase
MTSSFCVILSAATKDDARWKGSVNQMKILITNDDGIHAPGIRALITAVPKGVEAIVAAPASERSASSHSISLGQRLRIEEIETKPFRQFAVHGTPADCVKFAIAGIRGFKPDLIFSGINQGANTGVSVFYSGTISAAREGFINRFPSVAISLCSGVYRDFSASVMAARYLMEAYKAKRLPTHAMLNVNVPPLPLPQIKGIRMTKQAESRFIEEFAQDKDRDGKKVYTLTGEIELYDKDGTSDEEAVSGGYISITPLKIDLTAYDLLPVFKEWIREYNRIPYI